MSNEKNINHFRARIVLLLRERNWSFSELGRRIGRSPQNIYNIIEQGNPRASVLKEIADVLEVTTDVLLDNVTPDEYGEALMPVARQ